MAFVSQLISFLLITEIVSISLRYAEQYGTVIRAWLGSKLIIFLLDADDIEVILNSQVHIDKAPEYRFFKPWLGDGLLISTGICHFQTLLNLFIKISTLFID